MLAFEQCHLCTSRAYYAVPRRSLLSTKSLNVHRAASCLPQRQTQRDLLRPLVTCSQKHSASRTWPACEHQSIEAASCSSGLAATCVRASSQLRSSGLVAAAVLLPLLQQRWASAETLEAADASSAPPTDYLITGIFTVVVLALVIVTVGVAYLSLTSFWDKRAEDEDKKKFEAAQRDRDLQALGVQRPKRKRSVDEVSRGGGKGFGS
ncbi:hypothetical protein WJX75_009290 [Coccomyxa subellipsoidea]|uniref:Transmembrane protein n=1 Tax=Coccomyxa subellipsoidea TaxID=248742 RepID=A0ABR2YFM4_9CHLO